MYRFLIKLLMSGQSLPSYPRLCLKWRVSDILFTATERSRNQKFYNFGKSRFLKISRIQTAKRI